MKINHSSGQSLVEVVVAIGVITLVLVGLISALNFALANSQFARNKALANKYAQEAVEWLHLERDRSWHDFYSHTTVGDFCLANLNWNINNLCGPADTIDDAYDIFRREVTLVGNPPDDDRVTINIRTYWSQSDRVSEVLIDTILTQW